MCIIFIRMSSTMSCCNHDKLTIIIIMFLIIANYSANSGIGSTSVNRSLIRDSQKKKDRRKVSSEAEKILDAPSFMNDYCE